MPGKICARGTLVAIGGVLYIKSRNTRILERPDRNAKVFAMVQPPTQVVWLGSHESDRRWHKIQYGRHIGVVMGPNLTITKPSLKVTAIGPECRVCRGSGLVDARSWAPVPSSDRGCEPRGYQPINSSDPKGIVCPECGGTGIDPHIGSAYVSAGCAKA